MKKLAAITLVYILALAVCFAANGDAPVPFSNGLLWKVEKDGVRPSYIFGTIHLDDERVTDLPTPVKQAFADSTSFTMEMIIDEASTQKFLTAMLLAEGNLQSMIGDSLFAETADLMAKYGMPQEITERFKPWAVMLTLIMPKERQGLIVDNVLYQQALSQKKSVHQLENVDEQIAVFDGLPTDVQVGLLKQTVTHHDLIPDMVEKSIQAYLRRDLGTMWNVNNSLMETDADKRFNEIFLQRVLYDRNARMVERLQPLLKEGDAFVAVGALHLYGKKAC
ncbi:MAG: TraB/GumN family protein [Burkholderiales bacterium]